MSQADELLNDLVSDSGISVQLADPTTEPHIVIGDDRFISVCVWAACASGVYFFTMFSIFFNSSCSDAEPDTTLSTSA